MMKLKRTLQIKKRYLSIAAKNKESVEAAILDYIGMLGWAKASPVFVHSFKNNFPGKIILSVDRRALNDVRAALELSKEKIKILRVSGTLKGLSKK